MLGTVFEFRRLLEQERMGASDEEAQRKLAALVVELSSTGDEDKRAYTRSAIFSTVDIHHTGGSHSGFLVDASAGGAQVACVEMGGAVRSPPERVDLVIATVRDPWRYRFPARLAWSCGYRAGYRFVGLPTRTPATLIPMAKQVIRLLDENERLRELAEAEDSLRKSSAGIVRISWR